MNDSARPIGGTLPETSLVEGIVWPPIVSSGVDRLRRLVATLTESQWLPAHELRALQLVQLRALLDHAKRTVPYYTESLAGLDPAQLDWSGFTALPRIGRQDLQGRFDALCSTAIPRMHGPAAPGQSSGSTGTPVRFLQTPASQLFWYALTVREHLWHQRDLTGKLAAIRVRIEKNNAPDWGAPMAALYKTGPSAGLNVHTDTGQQLEWLQAENPNYLLTHASNLGALAALSLERGVRLPRLRQARTYSEALRPDLRERVRAAWGVEIADMYSCEEAGYIALQCPLHEHYHVQGENLLVEVLRPDGTPCEVGETGEVALTTLHNFALPLIRYRLGDYAEMGPPCDCGRGLPVLRHIHGRQRNMLVLPDGTRHWPSFPSVMWTSVAPIEQFQLVQRTPDRLEINYVMARELTADEKARLEAALTERLHYPLGFDWQRHDRLERSQGGKFEDFICLVA